MESGTILLPRGYCDFFFGCPTGVMTLVRGVMQAKNAAKHITMPNPGLATENYPAQIVNSVETEKLFSENED